MIKYKDGVEGEPSLPLAWALAELDTVYAWFGLSPTVTALRNGDHMPLSLHFRGYAADVRTSDIPPKFVGPMIATLKRRLAGFDVVIETDKTPGASAAHLHIEYDPEGNGGINLP